MHRVVGSAHSGTPQEAYWQRREAFAVRVGEKGDKNLLEMAKNKESCGCGISRSKESQQAILSQVATDHEEELSSINSQARDLLGLSTDLDMGMLAKLGDSIQSGLFHYDATTHAGHPVLELLAQPFVRHASAAKNIKKLARYADPVFRKYVNHYLLRDILDHLEEKVASRSDPPLKYVMYSLHDTNLIPLLVSLGIASIDCPISQIRTQQDLNCLENPYSSNLIFELRRDQQGSHELALKYNGRYYTLADLSRQADYRDPRTNSPVLTPFNIAKQTLKELMFASDSELKEACSCQARQAGQPANESEIFGVYREKKETAVLWYYTALLLVLYLLILKCLPKGA